jgi:hypothetical protein
MRIKLKARNQTVMATIQETDKRYIFKFPYNKTLLKEVKNLGGTYGTLIQSIGKQISSLSVLNSCSVT